MSTQPVPSTLTPFSSLASKSAHTKVRFLGRVCSPLSIQTGTISLHDPSFSAWPRKSLNRKRKRSTFLREDLTARVDIDQVQDSIGAAKVGDIVSVIGYIQWVKLTVEQRQRIKTQADTCEIERQCDDTDELREECMPAIVQVQAIVAWHVRDVSEIAEQSAFKSALVHRHTASKKMDGIRKRWASLQNQ